MRTKAIGLALALAFGAGPAAAMEHTWRVADHYVIRTHDLDLATPDGQAALRARVAYAARKLCGRAGSTTRRQACVADAVARAKLPPLRPVMTAAAPSDRRRD